MSWLSPVRNTAEQGEQVCQTAASLYAVRAAVWVAGGAGPWWNSRLSKAAQLSYPHHPTSVQRWCLWADRQHGGLQLTHCF